MRGSGIPGWEDVPGAAGDGDSRSSAWAPMVVEFRGAGGFGGQETVEGGDAGDIAIGVNTLVGHVNDC